MSKTVFITGSSRGIGRETAILYARKGYNVIINCSKESDELHSLENVLKELGAPFMSFVKDVAQFDNVNGIFNILKESSMIPDIVINNAGISYVGLLQDMTPDEWQRIINTNLTSVFNVCKCAIPYFLHKGCGRIINISSMWGVCGASCETAYSASKGGVNSFTKALAKELAPSRIAVNAVAFGVVDTSMNAFLSDEERRDLIDEIPAGRMCTPLEAAHIIYDISNLSEYVTGQIITADGGLI